MHLSRPLTLLLVLAVGCEDLREFRMEADPPVDVIRIGTDLVGRQTPFVYPLPARMRSEPEPEDPEDWEAIFSPRFMEILIRDSANREALHRFRKVFRYPAQRPSLMSRGRTRPQGWMGIVLPGVSTDGSIWIQGSDERLRLCTARRGMAMVVRRPSSAGQHFYDSGDPRSPMSPSGTQVEQVLPGPHVISLSHWRLEMDLPEGVTVFVDEGKGRSDYLHLSYPRNLAAKLATEGSSKGEEWIHDKGSLLAPLFRDASLWTTSLIRYGSDGTAAIVVSLPGGRALHMKVLLRTATRKPPPLLLALTLSR